MPNLTPEELYQQLQSQAQGDLVAAQLQNVGAALQVGQVNAQARRVSETTDDFGRFSPGDVVEVVSREGLNGLCGREIPCEGVVVSDREVGRRDPEGSRIAVRSYAWEGRGNGEGNWQWCYPESLRKKGTKKEASSVTLIELHHEELEDLIFVEEKGICIACRHTVSNMGAEKIKYCPQCKKATLYSIPHLIDTDHAVVS